MYNFVTQFEKVCFRAHCTQIWGTLRLAFNRYMFLIIKYMVKIDFQNSFLRKVNIRLFRKISKCELDSLYEKWKYYM